MWLIVLGCIPSWFARTKAFEALKAKVTSKHKQANEERKSGIDYSRMQISKNYFYICKYLVPVRHCNNIETARMCVPKKS